MRIAFTGAQCTGKTTLVTILGKELLLPILTGQIRRVASSYGITSVDGVCRDVIRGREFQQRCLLDQIWHEENYQDGFISERSVICNAFYWLKHHSFNAPSSDSVNYYQMVMNHLANNSYDLLIYLPPEIPLVADGFRSNNEQYRQESGILMHTLAKAWCPPDVLYTISGTIEERMGKVMQLIQG